MPITVTTRLPEKCVQELKQISKAEHLDKSEVVRRLLADAIKQWKIKRALELYKEEAFSIGQASHFAEVSPWQFFDLLKEHRIPVNYDTEEFERDLKTIQWKQ